MDSYKMENYFQRADWESRKDGRNGLIINDNGIEIAFYDLGSRFEFYASDPQEEAILEFEMIFPGNENYDKIEELFEKFERQPYFQMS